jgi:hypothetical protein
MEALPFTTLLGAWISIFLTLAVLSFLYEDNPVYKFAEHLFMGVSVGIGVTEQWYGVFRPNLVEKLVEPTTTMGMDLPIRAWSFVPLALLVMLFFKVSKRYGWVSRIPIAFLVAAYAGVKLTGEANANLMTQVAQSMPDLSQSWQEHGFFDLAADGAGVFSDMVLVLGLAACLIHFYFSQVSSKVTRNALKGSFVAFGAAFVIGTGGLLVQGELGFFAALFVGVMLGVVAAMPFVAFSEYRPWVTRFGVLVLMLSFGASFGYTVMGRISLAIGRAQEMLGYDRPPAEAAQIHPVAATIVSTIVIVALLVVWRKRHGPSEPQAT